MINQKQPSCITKTIVPARQRLTFLPKQTVKSFMLLESLVYQNMDAFCDSYTGGYWEYCELSNSGFYLAPTGQESFNVLVSGNGFRGCLSSDATGIVVTAFALNQVIWQTRENGLIDKYRLLLDYADTHEEAPAIFSAID